MPRMPVSLAHALYGTADPKLLELFALAALNPIHGVLDPEEYREALHAALDLLHQRHFELEQAEHRIEHWKRRALEAEGRGGQ